MTTLTHPKTFQDLLEYDDGTDNLYELINGELRVVAPESFKNRLIATYLGRRLEAVFPMPLIQLWGMSIEVHPFPGMPNNRLPDLVILHPDHPNLLAETNGVSLNMPPPQLIAEVVSPYKDGRDPNFYRDYLQKPQQYSQRSITEYWIIDPQRKLIELNAKPDAEHCQYQETFTFTGAEPVRSRLPQVKDLQLTVAEILEPEG